MADYPRYSQIAHGFKQLTAIRSTTGGWRKCVPGETIHLVVARVYGPDAFSAIHSGEIDGLSGITRGAFYGVGADGTLQSGVSPIVAIGSRADSVIVISDGAQSTASIAALYQALSEKGMPNGYAPLGSNGIIPSEYIPVEASADSAADDAKRRSWMRF